MLWNKLIWSNGTKLSGMIISMFGEESGRPIKRNTTISTHCAVMRWISAGLADVLCVSYTDTQEICSNLTAPKEFTGQRLFLPRGVGILLL